jgi:hypothetical protein
MPGLVMIDGVPHRERRGKLVVIPAEWFGKVTTDQTIRKRRSKQTAPQRREHAHTLKTSGYAKKSFHAERHAPIEE